MVVVVYFCYVDFWCMVVGVYFAELTFGIWLLVFILLS